MRALIMMIGRIGKEFSGGKGFMRMIGLERYLEEEKGIWDWDWVSGFLERGGIVL